MSGWIGVDLDGTLARYDGWKDGEIGEPVPAMVERVKQWLAEGKEVKIFTARVSVKGGYSLESHSFADENFRLEQLQKIRQWCIENIGQALDVTCIKDFSMISLYDDRCIQVEMNTGRLIQDEHS